MKRKLDLKMSSVFNMNVRQQPQSKKPAGSNKALRAALRQQRRTQVNQNRTVESNNDVDDEHEEHVAKDAQATCKTTTGTNDEKKEKNSSKKKSKGLI